MKNFYFLSFLLFLMSINNSINNIYETCESGWFGRDCTQNCSCSLWSSNFVCSKLEGRCLGCKFGHFGKKCKDICRPECKTNLCCAVKDKSFEKSNKKIEFNAAIIKIKIGNTTLDISADYNVGYPLTIFSNSNNTKNNWTDILGNLKNGTGKSKYIYQYSDYKVENSDYYNNCDIEVGNEKTLKLNIPIIVDNRDTQNIKVDGVIGLGFLNTINTQLFEDSEISLNIASYEIKKDKVSIIFGDLFGNEKDYVHKLSYCNAREVPNISSNNNTFLKCLVKGMKRKTDSDALKLDTFIQFSLNQDSSFILKDIDNYTNYIIKYFFKKKNYEKRNYTIDNKFINYYCFKNNKINKLSDFGFILNDYYYSYKADKFFVKNNNCDNGYSQFIIQFSNDTEGLIFGKNFFKDTQITIDNEEGIIYFYTKNVEYFSGHFKSKFNSEPDIIKNPFALSLIGVGIILLLNVLSFLLYFYFKRKKEKIN